MTSTSCHVCGATEVEPHFGGVSCRACAAFFRRYFHSKKSVISCTCQIRYQNSHPCRECRIQKCFEAGMNPEKVQVKREKHPKKLKLELTHASSSSASSSQSPPSLPISPVPYHIVSRNNSTISYIVSTWEEVQDKRSILYKKRFDDLTYYEMCLNSKIDCEILWGLCEYIFPQIKSFSNWDRNAVLRNFNPKWSLLAASIDSEKNRHLYENVSTVDDYLNMIVKFFSSSMYGENKIGPSEIVRVFEPFITFYGVVMSLPINAKKFNSVEYMALAMLLLFDGAHTNISAECSDMCHDIKNVVLRELRGYYIDHCVDEMRFFETIDTVNHMEKGEGKFHEELLACELHGVHIHEDYRLILHEQKY